MKRLIVLFFCGLLLFGTAGNVFADDADSHTVTVSVPAIDNVDVIGGNLTINITALDTWTSDLTTSDLEWQTNQSDRYITVETDQTGFYYELRVLADTVTGGTAASEVTVSTTPTNFVTAISTTSGGCNLHYRALAEPADGIGDEAHTITYTITGS